MPEISAEQFQHARLHLALLKLLALLLPLKIIEFQQHVTVVQSLDIAVIETTSQPAFTQVPAAAIFTRIVYRLSEISRYFCYLAKRFSVRPVFARPETTLGRIVHQADTPMLVQLQDCRIKHIEQCCFTLDDEKAARGD